MNRLLARAQTALRTAQHLLEYGDPVAAGNRAYFAVFDGMRAVLEHQGIDVAKIKTHHGLILSFEQNVVKPGRLEREIAAAIQKAAELRRVSDYEPEGDVSVADVRLALEAVSSFIERCARLIEISGSPDRGRDTGGEGP
jgi:uncharacterized protein (UPF0332 family)